MAYAVLSDSNHVLNIIDATPEYAASINAVLVPEDLPVSIGWLYDGVTFTPVVNNITVPDQIMMRQFRLALFYAGIDSVPTNIQNLNDPEKTLLQIGWECDDYVVRGGEFIALFCLHLNITESAMDALFIQAAQL